MKPRGTFTVQRFENPNKSTSFRVTGTRLDGTRVRENFPAEPEALARKQDLEIEALNFTPNTRIATTRLSPEQLADAEAAYEALNHIGHGSLLSAVEYYGLNYRDPLKHISTIDAVTKFLAEKTSANRRARYLKDLRQELGYLTAQYGNTLVHEIQKDALVSVIATPDRGPERQNNIRKDFRTFFNWCIANGFTKTNPAELVAEKTVERGEIVVLPIDKVRALMDAAGTFKNGKLVPYVALATFCAIRPDELARLSWDQIDLAEKQLTITSSAAKKRGRRVVDLPDNCIAWLRRHAAMKTPIKPTNWRKDFDVLKAMIGFGTPTKAMPELKPWPQDVLRHTGISCHYRLNGDEAKTASWAGNSPDMVHAHYRALMSAKDAKRFFEISPKRKKGGRIIELAAATTNESGSAKTVVN